MNCHCNMQYRVIEYSIYNVVITDTSAKSISTKFKTAKINAATVLSYLHQILCKWRGLSIIIILC